MNPSRISIVTYNLWGTRRWPDRKDALAAFLRIFRPDVLCLQEICPELLKALDETLETHQRVSDPFPGWECEGQIYWNRSMFESQSHGAEEIGMYEPQRRLFWTRLRLKHQDRTVLIGTAHFTWQGNEKEREGGFSPRVDQARRAVEVLDRLQNEGEPVLFMGDLNDPFHPRKIFAKAGYQDCFTRLGLPLESTQPARPIAIGADQALDWIVSNELARPIAASVPHFYHNGLPPSDHWPVHSVYEIG